MSLIYNMNNIYLFVYGTMKKGFTNHGRLDMTKFLGSAITVEKYAMYSNAENTFPCVIKNDKKYNIKGELYQIYFQDQIDDIDRFEGVPKHYKREEINIKIVGSDELIKAYIYFYQLEDYDNRKVLSRW